MAVIVHPLPVGQGRLPILTGFTREIAPAVVVLWAALIGAYAVTERDYLWMVLPWATVTLIMLWPVGRSHGRPYLSYRTPLFILGVLSMAYIPLVGLVLGADVSYWVKLALFLALPVDLTVFGIIPGLRRAIGDPLPMFFRPDLLFGDGRVLCCGTIALVLGLRYFLGHPPAPGVPVPIPRWSWYGIFFAVVAGFVPLIALRGVVKLSMRLLRLRDGTARGWDAIFVREVWLVLTVLAIGFGFHNAFKGWDPFVTSRHVLHNWSWVPILSMTLAALFLIFVRGGFKRRIGDPFIRERVSQSVVKQVMYVAGVVALMWSLMSVLDTELGDVERAGYLPMETSVRLEALRSEEAHPPGGIEVRRLPSNGFTIPGIKGVFVGSWNWVGVGLVAWGLVVLIPFRVLVQHHQRHAIVAHLAAIIVPAQSPEHRERLVRAVVTDGLLAQPPEARRGYLLTLNRALASADPTAREATTQAMVNVLCDLPPYRRDTMIESQADALRRCSPEERRIRLADMMTALARVPDEQRAPVVSKMQSLLQ